MQEVTWTSLDPHPVLAGVHWATWVWELSHGESVHVHDPPLEQQVSPAGHE
jgi:hypothetical protein